MVVGITANCCVSTTVRDASDLGYGVMIVEECTADYDQPTHGMAINGLYFDFACVIGGVGEALATVDAHATV